MYKYSGKNDYNHYTEMRLKNQKSKNIAFCSFLDSTVEVS